MLATSTPTDDYNRCWFCRQRNLSTLTTCAACKAPMTPTPSRCGRRIPYRFFSSGCNCSRFSSSPQLHEVWFDSAVCVLEQHALVAVRVGSISESAILIKDANGMIRSHTRTTSLGERADIGAAEFVRASRNILWSHADRTAGKPSLQLHNCYIALIQFAA
jgi:hypothetical protein